MKTKKGDFAIVKISDLKPDDRNNNKGTQYGQHLVEQSISKFGAGRSILIDRDGKIIAGNKFIENAGALGFEEVIVIPTDGKRIVAVQRTDVELDSAFGREMAIADNATAVADIEFDQDIVGQLADEFDIDPHDWGIDFDPGEVKQEDPAGGSAAEMQIIVKSRNGGGDLYSLVAELQGRGFDCNLIE